LFYASCHIYSHVEKHLGGKGLKFEI